MNKKFEFTKENLEEAKKIIGKYPKDRIMSASIPVLMLAQKQNHGYSSTEVIEYVASFLGLPPMSIREVANFYTMFNTKPVGKYHFQVCGSVVCHILNSDDLFNTLKRLTGTVSKDVSADGLFTVSKVECLGACVNAVALKINDMFVENPTKEEIKKIVEDLKNGKQLEKQVKVQKPLQIT